MTDPTPDPAQLLRRAAALLREHATAATPGPWRKHRDGYPHLVLQGALDAPACDAEGVISTNLAVNEAADSAYIALMHPGVGAALADWLDAEAARLEAAALPFWQETVGRHALAVARQLLGEGVQR